MKEKARGIGWTQPCRDPKNRLSGHGGNVVMVQGTRSRDPFQQYDFSCPFTLSTAKGLQADASNPSLRSG